VTGANVNDGKRIDQVLSAIVVEREPTPIRRSKHLCADAGYRSAEALGIIDTVGTITEGKLADLVVMDGDVLQDFSELHRTVATLKEGRIVYGALPER